MKRFLKFTLPSVLSMWAFALYTIFNGYLVANYVGETEFSAINISMPVMATFFAVSMLFSIGTQAKVGFNLGSGDYAKANEILSSGFFGLVICGFIYVLLLSLFLAPVVALLGPSEIAAPYVADYLRILVPFGVFFMTTYQLEVLIRVDGFPHLSALSVFLTAFINVALGFLFVARLGMGVFGAGLASGIAQIASTVFLLTHFARKRGRLRLLRHMDFRKLKSVLPLGVGDAITELSAGYTVFLFNRTLLDTMGQDGVVFYTAISNIAIFVQATMGGVAQGLSPLFSYDFGRGKLKSVRNSFLGGMFAIVLTGAVFAVAANVCSGPLIGLFLESGSDTYIAAQGAFAKYSTAFAFLGMNVLIITFFASMGKGLPAISVSLLRTPVCISIVMFIYRQFIGGEFIWYVLTVSEVLTLCVAAAMLYKYILIPLRARKITGEEL